MKRVTVEQVTYTHTQNAKGESTGKAHTARAYALVHEDKSPVFVGLFVTEAKAEEFCKARGWKFVKEGA